MALPGRALWRTGVRQVVAGCLVLALSSFASPQAIAGGPAKRTIEKPYRSPAIAVNNDFGYCYAPYNVGCFVVRTKAGETSVTLQAIDTASPTVSGYLYYLKPNGATRSHPFCGAIEDPVPVRSRAQVVVAIMAVPCEDGTPATATTGVVQLTFYRGN